MFVRKIYAVFFEVKVFAALTKLLGSEFEISMTNKSSLLEYGNKRFLVNSKNETFSGSQAKKKRGHSDSSREGEALEERPAKRFD